MVNKDNLSLKDFYDRVYRTGESEFFSFFEDGKHISEDHLAVANLENWFGKTILDVGCGTGKLVREIEKRGCLSALGIDYSEVAIAEAKSIPHSSKISFLAKNIYDFEQKTKFDIITSLGVIEHFDKPTDLLKTFAQFLHLDGSIVITCPHFLNLRGYIWMALVKLFDVPMSLSDLHFIHPWDLQKWAHEADLTAELVTTIDREWAYGQRLLKDFEKRIPNALRDANLSIEKVDRFMSYLGELTFYLESNSLNSDMQGATAVWRLKHQ